MNQPNDADHAEQSRPVVCFNVNPSVERTCLVDQFELGAVNRTVGSIVAPSGKAATVARTVANLGMEAIQVGPLGGEVGESFARLASAEHLTGDWLWVAGETRTNITIVALDGSPDTILNEPGPQLDGGDWLALADKVRSLGSPWTPVCVSGSMPPGVASGDLTALAGSLRERDVPVFVDSHGWALEALLEGHPWCAKVNHHEAAALLGKPIDSVTDAAEAGRELLRYVDGLVIVTMGAAGAVLVTADSLVAHVEPPKVDAVSGVGSGDTFLGALIVAIFGQKRTALEAVMYASAAGAVNATSTKQGHVKPRQVEQAMRGAVAHVLDSARDG